MSNGNSSTSSGGVGILGLLGVAFVILKLCGVINWSWWWVTAPFWGGIVLVVGVFAAIALAALIATFSFKSKKGRRR